jgi:DNA-binding transcriptional MerR regulator
MKKRYFIKELEKILQVNRKTYFYWEQTGKVPKAKRTPMGNYRYWTKEEIDSLRKLIEG